MAQQDYFSVLAMQPEVYFCADRKEIREKNLNRQLELLDFLIPYTSGIVGAPCRLVVFPEFHIHGLPQNADGSWNGVAIDIPGEETELIGGKAKEYNVYIAAHAWEEYPDLPGRPFSIGFVISPDGKVILKHHKFVSRSAEAGSNSPGDSYDWYVKKFGDGLDAFFPVADTEIGKMGFAICGEGTFPEISRGLMMNGAEIILRPNAWIEPFMAEPQDMMAVLSRFNAYANICYVVEANWGYYYDAPGWPKGVGAGRSEIIDYTGRILARSYESGEASIMAEINMQSLRRYREECGFCFRMGYMPNYIFRKVYETELWPKNSLLEVEKSKTVVEWEEIRHKVIESRRDIYTPSKKT